jgi:hypothetical protein
VRVPLGDGLCGYGRQLADGVQMEFYDVARPCAEDVDLEAVRACGLAFQVGVHDDAFREGGTWTPLGVVPLTEQERTVLTETFRQDAVDGSLWIYWVDAGTGGWGERPATYDEVLGLERASIWEPEHVEDRLRDHFSGRPCRWIEPPARPPAP